VAYRLGVDLGTTYTAAAVLADGAPGGPEMLPLGNRAMQVPSVLFVRDDGEMLVGEAAERRGITEPARVVREFKRRVGDPVPLVVGGRPYSPQAMVAKLLSWVVGVATERRGEPPAHVTVTYPANWGPFKRDLLTQAIAMADLVEVDVCTEPEAAAITYAWRNRVAEGDRVAVYDLGGGTFDAAVLERKGGRFGLVGAPEGVEHLGGIDFDEAVFHHVVSSLRGTGAELEGDDDASLVALARLRRDCVEAKEALSADTETVVPVVLPGTNTSVRLTRGEFEDMLRPSIQETVAALRRVLRSSGTEPARLAAIVLVGGSSRIPLVSELLSAEFGRPLALDTHPKHDVALGAALRTAQGLAPSAAEPARAATPAVSRTTTTQPVPPPDPFPVAPPTPTAAPDPTPAPATGPPAGSSAGSAAAATSAAAAASAAATRAAGRGAPPPPPSGRFTTLPTGLDDAAAAASPGPDGYPATTSTRPSRFKLPALPSRQAKQPKPARHPQQAPPPGTRGPGGGPGRIVAAAAAVVAVAAAVALLVAQPWQDDSRRTAGPGPGPTTTSSATPTTPDDGLPRSASPVPADVIVFPRSVGGNWDIATVPAAGGTEKRLTTGTTNDSFPVISSDRRTVIYMRRDGEDTADLRVMAADGTGDRPLFEQKLDDCPFMLRPAWRGGTLVIPCRDLTTNLSTLRVVTLEGKVLRILDSGVLGDPTLSPEGRTVYYWRTRTPQDGGELVRAPVDGAAEPEPITDGKLRENDPHVSPNGNLIAFTRLADPGIWLAGRDGSAVKQLTDLEGDQDPAWSPDGERIAFKRNKQLWVMAADGTGAKRVTSTSEEDTAAAWTPR
jgi:molecular chaperone DnaK